MIARSVRAFALVAALPLLLLLDAAALQAQDPPAVGNEAEALRRRVVLLEERVVRLESLIDELGRALRVGQLEIHAPMAAPPRAVVQILADRHGWQRTESWRRLRLGLSAIEVRNLLGEPAAIAVDPLTSVWVYPSGARVTFGTETRRLEGWSEW
jgi:hypothetical protein